MLKSTFKVPNIVELVVPRPQEGAVDSKGFAMKVVLYLTMFPSSLQLPFCLSVHDMLGFFHLAPT